MLFVAVAIDQVTGAEHKISANLCLIARKCLLKSSPQPLDKRKSSKVIVCMSYTVALKTSCILRRSCVDIVTYEYEES